ncbi:VanZ family protein [Hyunsoonleella rubra]|uniref:VanZ family protein n=1 Tax=Hyunsoonleella rubra TaxID=1737062 RepID=A0ABW5TC51_9FLAO
MLKTYSLFLAVPYTIALMVGSLMSLKNMPDTGVDYADKIFHFLAYAILCFLWVLVFHFTLQKPLKKAVLFGAGFAILFGIIIEVLQGTLTKERSLDAYDAIANSLGALTTSAIILLKGKLGLKNG